VAVAALGLLSIAASVVFGQAPAQITHAQILHATGPPPSFEVATVKPWQPPARPIAPSAITAGAPDTRPALPPRKIDPMGAPRAAGQRTDRVHIIGQAAILIQSAFNLSIGSENLIIGAPAWANSEADRYEIQAKIDDASFAAMQKMTPEQQREQVALMEQSLLADRFKLKVHFETRDLPAFALVVAKGGAKLTPAQEGEHPQLSSSSTETTGTAVTLYDFARSPLLRPNGRIVINQTGLEGAYDFTVKGEPGPDPPSFFTLIEEQLGLKLVPTKASVEVIIIDHIEKPTED
jgi:bla regulator protein BlaR1